MNVELLDKTRKLTKMIHNETPDRDKYADSSHVLSEILASEIVIVRADGQVLAKSPSEHAESLWEFTATEDGKIDDMLNERLLGILSTKENVNLETLGIEGGSNQAMIAPVIISGERLATLLAYRKIVPYNINSIILIEYCASIVGMQLAYERELEEERAIGKAQNIQAALSVMSVSEKEAAWYVLREMKGKDGILVASRLAQKEHLTRSVIVNTLRKMESAGVLTSRSSGMKGTYVHFLNPAILRLMEEALESEQNNTIEKRTKKRLK